MERGELFLAPFTYADLEGVKRRPVCVISSGQFNRGPDVIVAMVTSSRARLQRPGLGDVVLKDWRSEGLLTASVLRTGRLQTMESRLLSAPLGVLSERDAAVVGDALRRVLELD
ncbi:MAG: type II toxin-antitoxin system PemK/MazF family toxin [Actinomycetota bacterium]